MIVPHKTCGKCKASKTVTDFTPIQTGYYPHCRACKAAAQAERRRLNPREKKPRKKPALPPPNKFCVGCGVLKTADNTSSDHRKRSGLKSRCKTCLTPGNAAYMRQRRHDHPEEMRAQHRQEVARARAADPERHREVNRRWKQRNPEKARQQVHAWYVQNKAYAIAANHKRRAQIAENGGEYTREEWEVLKKQYSYRCLCCGKQEPVIELTVDHVLPISKGGRNDVSNLQPLCSFCNKSKHAKFIDYRSPS